MADDKNAFSFRQILLPLDAFVPTFRGRVVPGAGPLLDAGRVNALGLMASRLDDRGRPAAGFRAGPFRLAVRSVAVVRVPC